jgi:hypothetical protein
MRSDSPRELVSIVFAASAGGVWTGAFVAAVSGSSGPAAMVFAAAVIFVAAVSARRVAGRRSVSLQVRAFAAALTLVVAALLGVSSRVWQDPRPVWPLVGDVLIATLLIGVGLLAGGDAPAPELAARRAVGGFLLLCTVLFVAATAGSVPAWAMGAVIASLLSGGLLVADARYRTLRAMVQRDQLGPAWSWLLAVAGVILLVVAGGVLLGAVLSSDVILWAASLAGDVASLVLRAAGFAVAWFGAAILRAGAWVLDLLHVGSVGHHQVWRPKAFHRSLPHRASPDLGAWRTPSLILYVAAVVAAVVLPLALVSLALRRLHTQRPEEVLEEREAIASVRPMMGRAVLRLGERLLRAVPRRRAAPATLAERIRGRYADLEGRLADRGWSRAPGTTARSFLLQAAACVNDPEGRAHAEAASIYELARYSGREMDLAAAGRFDALALAIERQAAEAPGPS